jgi:hypothetical protein
MLRARFEQESFHFTNCLSALGGYTVLEVLHGKMQEGKKDS